jgi:hypothetical protein
MIRDSLRCSFSPHLFRQQLLACNASDPAGKKVASRLHSVAVSVVCKQDTLLRHGILPQTSISKRNFTQQG